MQQPNSYAVRHRSREKWQPSLSIFCCTYVLLKLHVGVEQRPNGMRTVDKYLINYLLDRLTLHQNSMHQGKITVRAPASRRRLPAVWRLIFFLIGEFSWDKTTRTGAQNCSRPFCTISLSSSSVVFLFMPRLFITIGKNDSSKYVFKMFKAQRSEWLKNRPRFAALSPAACISNTFCTTSSSVGLLLPMSLNRMWMWKARFNTNKRTRNKSDKFYSGHANKAARNCAQPFTFL